MKAQREEVQQKLDRLILKMAALEAEVHEKTDIISLLNRDKNTLEAEVTALRVSPIPWSYSLVTFSVERY